MPPVDSDSDEAITKEEIQGTEVPAASQAPPAKPRNAFTELMAAKPKPQSKSPGATHSKGNSVARVFKDRDGLGAYIANPGGFPPSRVIYHTPDFVAIHDLYPKASVHCLLLPRSDQHNLEHPFDAFEDAAFLASVKAETAKLKTLVAKELQRRFGPHSKQDAAREAVLNGTADPPDLEHPERLPEGRDWEAEVKVGVHAHPSMSHLHVHVFSRDMHSPCLKHRKHYNSFNTPFLVDIADFPLAEDDPRRHPGHEGFMKQGMVCWRCGRDFKNKFKELKDHLEIEFGEWKRE